MANITVILWNCVGPGLDIFHRWQPTQNYTPEALTPMNNFNAFTMEKDIEVGADWVTRALVLSGSNQAGATVLNYTISLLDLGGGMISCQASADGRPEVSAVGYTMHGIVVLKVKHYDQAGGGNAVIIGVIDIDP